MAGDKEDTELTRELSSLAEALPELLERFRQMARSLGRPEVAAGLGEAQPAQALDVAAALDVAVEAARAELTARARLVKVYAPAPPVLATERQLGLVLLSLVVHAAQAIPPGGAAEHVLELRVAATDEGWTEVAIEPSGPGVEGRAGAARLVLPPAVAPRTDVRA